MKTINRRAASVRLALALSLSGITSLARAEAASSLADDSEFKGQTLRIIVPYPPGGSLDMIGRILAQKLGVALQATIVVDNRPGASGMIGTDAVVKSAPDGKTLLLTVTALVQTPHLMKVPYDPMHDLVPIQLAARAPTLFVVRSDLPAHTLPEFIALVKSAPAKYSLGNFGNGSTSHIQAVMLNDQAGLGLPQIPYKGVSLMVNDLIGGQVTAGFTDAVTVLPHVSSGRLRVLAVTGTQRMPRLPQVPTMSSEGFKDFDAYGWLALFAPARTPAPAVTRLSQEIAKALAEPDFVERLEAATLIPARDSRTAFASQLQNDAALWARLIKNYGITAD